MRLDDLRNARPATPDDLWRWVYAFLGVKIARTPVCKEHQPPWDAFRSWFFDEPKISLMLGPRGGGKSMLAALRMHVRSRFHAGHHARVLGGSKAQSRQIYENLKKVLLDNQGPLGTDGDTVLALLAESARYRNSSALEILAASSRSVRGAHVPLLLLDEVDEIDPDLREAAFGMCVADRKRDIPASIGYSSTWHRVGGPMAGLIDDARQGKFPLFQFCIFEVLERCPTERSGPNLEKCPECPIQRWCHADRDERGGVPKAKRSDGHYSIDALIQKAMGVSLRVFEADYLCRGPKADGLWFPDFTRSRHVSLDAEFDPALPVHLAVDSGVHTGAVWFQVAPVVRPDGSTDHDLRVFADYYAMGKGAFDVAGEILEVTRQRAGGRADHRSTDPAGGARNPVGPTVLGEYAKAGLKLDRWPIGSVSDGLSLVESFVGSAGGAIGLQVHPRCGHLIAAFEGYSRAKRQGQWIDAPEDPQHPHEDLVDALRGGLRKAFPGGRRPQPRLQSIPAQRMF